MVSEVNSSTPSIVTALDNRNAKVDKTNVAATATPGAGDSADVVKITDLASRLQELTQAVGDVPTVDRQRVEAFRQQLTNGTYQADPSAIAEKLATFESMLTTPKSS